MYMKLLKTIEKIIQESEEQYNSACDGCVTVEELDRLEKHYRDSLKLLSLYKSTENQKSKMVP
jgi:DNA invertase Pin-like site-specific DNA recombinase